MLMLVLVVSMLCALPNFYGEDPAVQITGVHGTAISQTTLVYIKKVLEQQHINIKSIFLKNNIIIACFYSTDVQLRAIEVITNALDQSYVVALNLVPVTPIWLTKFGVSPMKLGLDLRGGIHFLMEVNTEVLLKKLQEQMINDLRSDLLDKVLPYIRINKINNNSSEIYFKDSVVRDQALFWLSPRHRNLIITKHKKNIIYATLSNNYQRLANEYAVQQNIIILRNRINQLGITDPLVQRYGANFIVVELPGIQNTARAKEIIGATATLEFRLVNNSVDPYSFANSHIPEDSEVGTTRDGQLILLYKPVILTGDHITGSTYSIDEYNRPQVNLSLDDVGGITMSNFTKSNIGKLMATLFVEYKDSGKKDINGRDILVKREEIINVSTIQSQFSNNFRITGINDFNEARQLSLLLRAGTLITSIQIVEERIVGPTLGVHNITQGLKACSWGLAVSILFMVLWYRKFGLIAAMALIFNLILIIGIMSVLPGAVLTMPGIAGIVLTLAMAIDATVLINERIKEELRNGYTVQQAIHNGYQGAFSSIFDANVTTLITAIILHTVGTGSIKGFAITTVIGVVTSMFTAIIGTRAIVNLLYGGKRINKLSI